MTTRRDTLKLTGAAALGLLAARNGAASREAAGMQMKGETGETGSE